MTGQLAAARRARGILRDRRAGLIARARADALSTVRARHFADHTSAYPGTSNWTKQHQAELEAEIALTLATRAYQGDLKALDAKITRQTTAIRTLQCRPAPQRQNDPPATTSGRNGRGPGPEKGRGEKGDGGRCPEQGAREFPGEVS